MLLKGAKTSPNYVKDAMSKLLVEFPKVAFAAVDTSVLYVKGLEAEYLPEFVSGQPRFVVFQKVVDPKKPDRLKTSLSALPTNGVGYGVMSNLVGSVVQKTATMQSVPSLPTIKTRTKKLEQEEGFFESKIDKKTGEKVEYGSNEMIIEVFKKESNLKKINSDINNPRYKLLENNILKFY